MSRLSERDTSFSERLGLGFVALDAASRWRLKTFALRLAVVVLFAAAFAIQRHYPMLRTLAVFCGCQSLFAGVTAAIQRHRIDSATLTAWDEMAAFFGAIELARLIAAVAG
jgi:hypothetical protein